MLFLHDPTHDMGIISAAVALKDVAALQSKVVVPFCVLAHVDDVEVSQAKRVGGPTKKSSFRDANPFQARCLHDF